MKKVLASSGLILALAVGLFAAPAPALAATVVVQSMSFSGLAPTALDNDFTRISNAVNAAADNDVIMLRGVFDFTEPHAAAAWALGHDGIPGNLDDYVVDVPANLNNVTLTAFAPGQAVIQGPGDVPDLDLEGFLQFCNNGTNQGWTISNLHILDFDVAIGMYSSCSGVGNRFAGTRILNNYIRIAVDLNGVVAPDDTFQNIGIHLGAGVNQTVSGNTIDIPGNGLSDPASDADYSPYGITDFTLYASSVALQSNTHGGATYNGLEISYNTVRVLNGQSAHPERILGLWENGHAHTSNIAFHHNQFLNLSGANDPALNRQIAYRLTSHSGAATTVTFANNSAAGVRLGADTLTVAAGLAPLVVAHNSFNNVERGFLLRNNANLTFANNTLSGLETGIEAPATANAAIGTLAGSNFISGFAAGVDVNGGNAAVRFSALTGNGVGLLVRNGGTATIHNSDISGNFVLGVNNTTGVLVDATHNWWGSALGPGGANNDVSSDVDADPWAVALLNSATASTHEVGESSTLDTHVTVDGLYGAQLRVNHDAGVLTFTGGSANAVPGASPPWAWDQLIENFVSVLGGRRVSGSMQADLHPVGANLTGQSIATWNYTCAAPGTSTLMYDDTLGLGTILADINGFALSAALVGDSVTCTAATAASTDGYIALQGRLSTSPSPAGWNDAVVTLTCVGGGCAGHGPYYLTTDSTGHYALVKAGPGTGVALGTYSVSVSRRAYLGANRASDFTVAAGANTITPVPTLRGGDVNNDGTINILDLSAIGGAFGSPPAGGADTGADVNGDNIVNIFDLVLGGGNFGMSGPTAW